MKKQSKITIIGLFLVAFIVASCASSNDYLSQNFASARAKHKKIAILPFNVKFERETNNQKANSTRSLKYYEDQEFQASKDSQQELFLQLARQIRKGKFEMAIQDFNTTNKILDEKSIRVERLNDAEMGNLARVLGVDAILVGKMNINITQPTPYSMMPPNRYRDGIETMVKLYDAASGELLWNTSLSERPTSPNDTPHRISSNLLSQIARSIPYRK